MIKTSFRGIAPLFFLLFFVNFSNASDFVKTYGINLKEKAVKKMDLMAKEIKQKTNVSVYLVATKSMGGLDLKSFVNKKCKEFNDPKIVLIFAKNEKKVEICNASDLDDKFDKERILSPLPWKGSIIPLLTAKSKVDQTDAALFNGFAEICEEIAKSYDIKFENGIGNANKDTYNVIKLIFYGSLFIFFLMYLRNKFLRKE